MKLKRFTKLINEIKKITYLKAEEKILLINLLRICGANDATIVLSWSLYRIFMLLVIITR